jgi:hypothetical protein
LTPTRREKAAGKARNEATISNRRNPNSSMAFL